MFQKKQLRKATVKRKSTETEIIAELSLDGCGKSKIQTHIGILNHMLDLFAFHGLFDLTLNVKKADTEIDIHHTNEDIGIVLGKLFNKALGEKKEGIRRFGFAAAPMETTFSEVIVDISGRGSFHLDIEDHAVIKMQDGYAITYLEHFLESFSKNLGANVIIIVKKPSEDLHTTLETIFKALGLALDQATILDDRRIGVPSTKGIIDS